MLFAAAAEVVNTNSISAIALGFFTVIVSGIVTIIVTLIGVKHKAKDAVNSAEKAVVVAQEAVSNTVGVSNGFTGQVNRKLEWIVKELTINRTRDDEMSKAFREHLQWHMDKEKGHGKENS